MKKLLFLAIFLAALYFAGSFGRSAWIGAPSAGSPIAVVIPAHATPETIAHLLTEAHIISSPRAYTFYAAIDAKARNPRAGAYELPPGASFHAIARALALGPTREEVEVRLIEGWTVEDEAAALASEFQIPPTSTQASIGDEAHRAPMDPAWRTEYPFLATLPKDRSLEGYLFPDTYRVWKDQLPEGLIRKQLDQFAQRYGDATIDQTSAPLKTLDDVVILASIVEKEVREPATRKMVAGIFLRRLKEGMRLQSDATLSYVLGSKRARATGTDLATDSPYNTYQHAGLPPGPVSNPGATAIDAVLHPTPSRYRYFLTDTEGNIYYAETLEEHNANKRKAGY